MVDPAIVGRYVSEQALAAVGASYALTNIFICVAIGGGIGASVIVSRYFAQKNTEEWRPLYLRLCYLPGYQLSPWRGRSVPWKPDHDLVKHPQDCLDMAATVSADLFFGTALPFYGTIVLSAMFNALGKSRDPTVFWYSLRYFNVVLDIIMVTKWIWSSRCCLGYLIRNWGISAVLSLCEFLLKPERSGRKAENTVWYNRAVREMTRIAIPSILQQSTVSIGMMLVQSVVNGFGSGRHWQVSLQPCVLSPSVLCQCLPSEMPFHPIIAQNIGAQPKDRVVQGLHAASKMVIVCAAVICFFLEVFNRGMIGLFIEMKERQLHFPQESVILPLWAGFLLHWF